MTREGSGRAPILRLLTSVIFAIAVVWINLPEAADAHKISKSRVERVSHRLVKDLCQSDPTCLGVEVEPCHRKSKHVARCEMHYFGEDNIGKYDCHWEDEWEIKEGSHRLHWNPRVFENTLVCRRGSGGHFRGADGSQERPVPSVIESR